MKMRQLFSIVIPSLRQPQQCEACQEMFTCEASLTGCWCMEIKLNQETRQELRGKYQHCLCRTCLEGARDGALKVGQ